MNRVIPLVVVGWLCVSWSAWAQSQDIGPRCWQTNFLPDRVTMGITQTTPPDLTLFSVEALRWRASIQGTVLYQMFGSTVIARNETGTHYVLEPVVLNNRSPSFGGNPDCRLNAQALVSEALAPNGWTWSLDCTGGPGAPFFVSGVWSAVPCTAPLPVNVSLHSLAPEGKAAGE